MSRLIDVDLLFKEFEDDDYDEWNWAQVYSVLEAQPTVDAVPVVRCKDCKHFRKYSDSIPDVDGECKLHPAMVNNDWFCNFGERKEHGEAETQEFV